MHNNSKTLSSNFQRNFVPESEIDADGSHNCLNTQYH